MQSGTGKEGGKDSGGSENAAQAMRMFNALRELRLGDFDVQLKSFHGEWAAVAMELNQLANALRDRFEEVNRIESIVRAVNAGKTLDETLDIVFGLVGGIVPFDLLVFLELENDGRDMTVRWSRASDDAASSLKGRVVPRGRTGPEAALADNMPLVGGVAEGDGGSGGPESLESALRDVGMRAWLACPLSVKEGPFGLMTFASGRKGAYEGAHQKLLMHLTAQLSLMTEKARLYQKAVELNEMKNRFCGMAAHDLRNPLGVIQGYASMLKEGLMGELPEEAARAVASIDQSCEGMLDLLNDLLDSSAIASGSISVRFERISLARFLSAFHRENQTLAKSKNIALDLEVAEDSPEPMADPKRLGQVLNNLLTNAVKFSHPGTRIALKAWRDGEWFRISVADQGQGIPEEEKGRLFGEFQKLSVRPTAGEKSTGLGLAIVKKLVEVLGGAISVESQVGKGSTFTVGFPIERGDAGVDPETARPA